MMYDERAKTNMTSSRQYTQSHCQEQKVASSQPELDPDHVTYTGSWCMSRDAVHCHDDMKAKMGGKLNQTSIACWGKGNTIGTRK